MNRPSPAIVLNRFKDHLHDIFLTNRLFALLGATELSFDANIVLQLLLANNINPAAFVASVSWQSLCQQLEAFPRAGKQGRLLVGPCSPLFTPLLELLAENYSNICFMDLNRAGLCIGEKLMVHPDTVSARADDLCLILTRNTDACASYLKKFGVMNCINVLQAYLEKQQLTLSSGTTALLTKINFSKKPILFVSTLPVASLNSTIRQMNGDGFETFWLGSVDVKEPQQTGYAVPKLSDVALSDYGIGGLLDFLYTFVSMEQGVALYHYQTIYSPEWDFKRVAICYAATLALIRTVKECRAPSSKARLGLFMYDAIKPGVKNYAAGEACGWLFKAMMSEAEAIVFSSFTSPFGDFVENALAKKLPRVHHHRYQTLASKRLPRLKDGFHIAVLTSILGDVWQPSTEGLLPYLRKVIAQGIHLHHYAATNVPFRDSLPEDQQHLFHLHAPIHNLEELANEISQYHAGWSLFNMQVFNDMVANLTDQFTRDAMDLFTATTLPSVIWSCSAAGLPIICNRSLTAIPEMLPPDLVLPMTLSEVDGLHHVLDGLDWQAIDQVCLDQLDISKQVYKLYHFLEDYYAG